MNRNFGVSSGKMEEYRSFLISIDIKNHEIIFPRVKQIAISRNLDCPALSGNYDIRDFVSLK